MSNFLNGDDLIVNIVSRLPTESVLRCRCVCKRWRALLHELYFIQIHTDRILLQQQQQHIDEEDEYCPLSLFILVVNRNRNNYVCYLQDYYYIKYDDEGRVSSSSSSSSHKVISSPMNPSPSTVGVIQWSVISSINGLICLYGFNHVHKTCPELIIYNPITSEYLNHLPAADADDDDHIKDGRLTGIGFGYQPSTKEYKIVRIILHQKLRWLHIYTLGIRGGGKWRIIKVDPPVTYQDSCAVYTARGTYVNGAIYWLTESHTIVSFDLEDEKFRIIHAPHSARCCSVILGGGERLCVVCMVGQHSRDIWVMNIISNGDDQYSWTKEFSIPVILGTGIQLNELIEFGTIGAAGSRDRVVCLCETSDEQRSKFLISLDCRTKTFESLGDIKGRWSFDLTCYTKSLVSLKALGEENAKVLGPPKQPPAAAAPTKTQMMIKLFTSFLLHLFVDS